MDDTADGTPDAPGATAHPAPHEPVEHVPAPADPATDQPARRRAVRWGLVATLLVTAVLVVAADQVTKQWALDTLSRDGTPREVLAGWLQFRLVFNPGAAFNMATGTTWIFTLIATAVAVVILRVSSRLGSRGWAVALGLLLGGAVGNLVDRLTRPPGFAHGHVVDFIEYLRFPVIDFPVFNVADSCITTAAVLIALLGFLGIALDGSRVVDGDGKGPGA
jgi:signal peptidase II